MTAIKAGTTLTLSRTFAAPRELVFRMWTDARHLKQWWGPAGSDNGETRFDARPGGEIYIEMRGPGFDNPLAGHVEEIDPPRRLVFLSTALQNPDGSWQFITRNTVTFEAVAGGRTKVTLQFVVQQPPAQAVIPVGGVEMGWSGSFDRLAAHLAAL
ncbi:MAG TPA: SRPBCC domain-containing protein [Rhizomicrobium sp.]|nr:SRPBCC domain-containing protein [Rhizomicrobium sp.]